MRIAIFKKNFINIFKGANANIEFCHTNTFSQPDSFKLHISTFCEFYIFVSGDAGYIVEDKYFDLRLGDIIIMKPNEVHKLLLKKPCQYERFYILLPSESFSQLEDSVKSPLNCFLNRKPGEGNLISLPEKERGTAMSLLYKISEVAGSEDPYNKILSYSCLLRLLHIINSHFDFAPPEPDYLSETAKMKIGAPPQNPKEVSSHVPRILTEILHYINVNLPRIESIHEIAEHFYITLPYLSALFKRHFNVNISCYVQVKKIAMSKILLGSGSTVTEACFESGFNNCSYFISTFKKIVGVTPLKYKNNFEP